MNAYTCKVCFSEVFKGTGIIKEKNNETTCTEKIECKSCGEKSEVEYPISILEDSPIEEVGDFQINYEIENWHDKDAHLTFTSIE